VPKTIRFAEAPQVGRCILQHAPLSAGADAYRSIARRLDVNPGGLFSGSDPVAGVPDRKIALV